MKVVSFHGFAGAFAVAAKQAETELVAVVEPGGFGADAIERNRAFLEYDGPIDVSREPDIYDGDLLVGNPPCSGFSGVNTSRSDKARGPGSSINQCMWDLVSYAALMNLGRGPKVLAFESVQGAFRQGHGLMRELWRYLRFHTGEDYELTHVLVSGTNFGGAQIRKRYFFVVHRVPFGVNPKVPTRVVTYMDAIGDLERQPLVRNPTPYIDPPTHEFQRCLRSSDGLVGDHVHGGRLIEQRYTELHESWPSGINSKAAMQRYIAEHGAAPPSWEGYDAQAWMYSGGFSDTFRVYPHEAGRVITGSGGIAFMHYNQARVFTIREVSRLMGFPDAWRWDYASFNQVSAHMGKQVPVQSWRWMIEQMKHAVEGEPGWYTGEVLSNEPALERVADLTHDFKSVYDDRKRQHGVDARSKRWQEMMAARKLV